MRELLENLDNGLFVLINSGLGREWLDPVFLAFSSLGSGPILLFTLALLSHQGRRRLVTHLLILLALLLVFAPASKKLKRMFHRDRPAIELAEPEHADLPPVRAVGVEHPRRRSFPSGHTMLAFYTMVYAGLVRPGCRWWALGLAACVAFSRVYVGAHFPLDCVGGALFGSAAGWLAWRACRWADARFNGAPRGAPA